MWNPPIVVRGEGTGPSGPLVRWPVPGWRVLFQGCRQPLSPDGALQREGVEKLNTVYEVQHSYFINAMDIG